MQTDYLIVGSGIAGLNCALTLSQLGKVILITKKNLKDSATYYAQGGIAGVVDKNDSIKDHVSDTLTAGAHHNLEKSVKFMVSHSAAAIKNLEEIGVNFEKDQNGLKLTKEGGHHKNRIAYTGDHTGKSIEESLIKKIKKHKNIEILTNTFALELFVQDNTCHGLVAINNKKIITINSSITILATGGIGQIYKYTTNPKVATGDGIAMAQKAGSKTKDMEFIQFHPTALNKPISPRFLISETVRGEGAILLNTQNQRFMEKIHKLKELAPRDIVAEAIYEESKKGPVHLDLRGRERSYYIKRFPKIYKKLLSLGINMKKDLIPVIPAAHYICGGIKTDLEGRTDIKNLYAFGETAYTGVHGANRLASNSLLEGMVFSSQKIIIKKNSHPKKQINIKYHEPTKTEKTTLLKIRKEIKEIMWNYTGIKRNTKIIKTIAIPLMESILEELNSFKPTNELLAETQNMAIVSNLILKSAAKRQKSLGCHKVI